MRFEGLRQQMEPQVNMPCTECMDHVVKVRTLLDKIGLMKVEVSTLTSKLVDKAKRED